MTQVHTEPGVLQWLVKSLLHQIQKIIDRMRLGQTYNMYISKGRNCQPVDYRITKTMIKLR